MGCGNLWRPPREAQLSGSVATGGRRLTEGSVGFPRFRHPTSLSLFLSLRLSFVRPSRPGGGGARGVRGRGRARSAREPRAANLGPQGLGGRCRRRRLRTEPPELRLSRPAGAAGLVSRRRAAHGALPHSRAGGPLQRRSGAGPVPRGTAAGAARREQGRECRAGRARGPGRRGGLGATWRRSRLRGAGRARGAGGTARGGLAPRGAPPGGCRAPPARAAASPPPPRGPAGVSLRKGTETRRRTGEAPSLPVLQPAHVSQIGCPLTIKRERSSYTAGPFRVADCALTGGSIPDA